LYYLVYIDEFNSFTQKYNEELKARYLQEGNDVLTNTLLYNQPQAIRLRNDKTFQDLKKEYSLEWQGDDDILRKIFFDLKSQDVYTDFQKFNDTNPNAALEVYQFLLKHYINNFSILITHFEEEFYNFSDDSKIALQMASKSLTKLFGDDAKDFILPINPQLDEVSQYAMDLVELVYTQQDRLNEIINPKISKWEINQVPLMDRLILKTALAEFLYFPSIPYTVTINEYVELAKNYSTPNSKKFVNGVLDVTFKELIKQGVITKSNK
jgi:N utilization substance protein B